MAECSNFPFYSLQHKLDNNFALSPNIKKINNLTLYGQSVFFFGKQDRVKPEYHTNVLILIHNITENRLRWASGPVHFHQKRYIYTILADPIILASNFQYREEISRSFNFNFLGWDSPNSKFCYLSFWLELFKIKTLLVEKTVIEELGESQP